MLIKETMILFEHDISTLEIFKVRIKNTFRKHPYFVKKEIDELKS